MCQAPCQATDFGIVEEEENSDLFFCGFFFPAKLYGSFVRNEDTSYYIGDELQTVVPGSQGVRNIWLLKMGCIGIELKYVERLL